MHNIGTLLIITLTITLWGAVFWSGYHVLTTQDQKVKLLKIKLLIPLVMGATLVTLIYWMNPFSTPIKKITPVEKDGGNIMLEDQPEEKSKAVLKSEAEEAKPESLKKINEPHIPVEDDIRKAVEEANRIRANMRND